MKVQQQNIDYTPKERANIEKIDRLKKEKITLESSIKTSLWATKKAIMIVKKIEMDMLYRVVMEVYDAEVAH